MKIDWKTIVIGVAIFLITFLTLGIILKVDYLIVGLISGILVSHVFKNKSNSELRVHEIILFAFLVLMVLTLEFTGFKL